MLAARGKRAPDDPNHWIRLMKTLQQAGELQEALELFTEFDKVASFRSQNFYARGSQILGDLEHHEARIALMERALKDYPDSVWMHGEYSEVLREAKNPQEAWVKLRRALELDPGYSWGANRLVEYFAVAEVKTAVAEQVQEWIRRHPWQKAFWEQREESFTGQNATEQQIALWREAMQRNPGQSWPVKALVGTLVEEERWQEARQAVETLFKTEAVSAYDRKFSPLASSLPGIELGKP